MLLQDQVLVLRVDDAGEVARAMEKLHRDPRIAGLVLHSNSVEELWDTFREPYRFVQAAGGAVDDGQGRLLAIHRSGRWDLPKGKVEKGEAIDDAAMREVREECGLQQLELLARLCNTWHTYERNGRQHLKRTDWFHMRSVAGEPLVPQAAEDITEVAWLDAAGLARLKAETYPSLLTVVQAWERRVPGHSAPGPSLPSS